MNVRYAPRVLICMFSLFVCPVALTQAKPEPPQRTGVVPIDSVSQPSDQKLPQIDLPEFMITGHESIAPPEGNKSSYDDQRSFEPGQSMLSSERDARNPQLGAGVKDRADFTPSIEGVSGKVTTGYASYGTPFFDGWFGKDFGTADFLLKAGYRSSNGFAPNTDFRTGYGLMSIGTYLPEEAGIVGGARIQANLNASGDSYYPYGSATPTRQRSVERFSSDIALSSDIENVFSYSTAFHVRSTSLLDPTSSREVLLGADFSGVKEIEGVETKGDFGVWSNFYKSPSKLNNPFFSQLAISGRYRVLQDLDLTGGFRMNLLRGSDTRTKARLFPQLGVSWYAAEIVTLFARFDPYAQRSDMGQLIEANPYLVNDIQIRHPEYFVQFSLGAESELARNVRANAILQYKRVRDYAAFHEKPGSGLWTAEYSGVTRLVEFVMNLHIDVTERDYVGTSLTIRESNNSATGSTVPYLPSTVISGTYTHRFPFGLSLTTALKLNSSQYADRENRKTLPAFILADVAMDYDVAHQVGVSFGLTNLFNQPHRWWDGYAGRSRTAAISVSYMW